ncbi:hypothetical protein GCM10025770_15990 [Viridibacterium curvum]|uniref:Secreted protein n=1 Tax=Viridibacterium curvum TaxID=1101404 RepID=A0ABP9QKY0_9RHOO
MIAVAVLWVTVMVLPEVVTLLMPTLVTARVPLASTGRGAALAAGNDMPATLTVSTIDATRRALPRERLPRAATFSATATQAPTLSLKTTR